MDRLTRLGGTETFPGFPVGLLEHRHGGGEICDLVPCCGIVPGHTPSRKIQYKPAPRANTRMTGITRFLFTPMDSNRCMPSHNRSTPARRESRLVRFLQRR